MHGIDSNSGISRFREPEPTSRKPEKYIVTNKKISDQLKHIASHKNLTLFGQHRNYKADYIHQEKNLKELQTSIQDKDLRREEKAELGWNFKGCLGKKRDTMSYKQLEKFVAKNGLDMKGLRNSKEEGGQIKELENLQKEP